ncbi:MAG: methyl-accepting chemotaxis protein [Deltaproteobacteria bacterium]|nr:methyl-accepting chemotaxis protein [Deltaproteobacteria bacterium]
MFGHLSLGKKLTLGFLVIAVLLLIVGGFGYRSLDRVADDNAATQRTFAHADAAMEIKHNLALERLFFMELLASEDLTDFESVWGEHEEASSAFVAYSNALLNGAEVEGERIEAIKNEKLRALVSKSLSTYANEILPRFKELKPVITELHETRGKIASLGAKEVAAERALEAKLATLVKEANRIDSELDDNGRHMDTILAELERARKGDIQSIFASAETHASSSKTITITSIIIGFGAAILLGIIMARRISRPIYAVINELSGGADQVHDAAAQLSSSSQQLSQNASEQASTLEETSASIQQVFSMVKQNAENSDQANKMASGAKMTAERGAKTVFEMIDGMNQINKGSSEVSKIIKVINEIAFQTNLLALNAAVEAARAGEHGKGFAVVAEEVRNLAKRSAEAAKETTSLIEQSVLLASQGSAKASEAGGVLSGIVDTNKKMEDLVSEISAASREQSDGLEQVTKAITQIDDVTQQISAASEESAASAEELASQADSMKVLVEKLGSIIDGSSRAGSAVAGNTRIGKTAAPGSNAVPTRKITTGKKTTQQKGNGHAKPAKAVVAAPRERFAKVIPLNDKEEDEFKEF